MKIFLLEDDYSLNESIKEMLETENFIVDSFYEGDVAYENIIGDYELYIFDINVPNIDGLYLLEHIKNINPNSKVIMISANINIDQIKEAYLKGCDDYIKKPFDIEELLLKINKYTQKPHIIILDENLYFNKNDKKLFLNNIEIELTKNERNLLILLINNKSNKVSHSQIEDYIYDRVSKSSDAIRSLVKRLRRKITKDIIFNSLDEGYYIK
ncbi:two-component system response regulator [Arcobacter acticola]|jgi:DNA-binding response OmpR family regulator|uniref:Two-component system response regulator n=1 Tax=Arcobacter acticola TaxID=1849015 RepID=A0A6M8EL74_9BACT|nr:response regulator transcription factor [Arcobacter acticola]QKE27651.1 two-component system response regulator [Arcobacter acticola]